MADPKLQRENLTNRADITVQLLALVTSASAALLVSYILCVTSELSFSATLNEASVVLPASTSIVVLAMSWLVGHGLHSDRQSLSHLFVTLKAHASILIFCSVKRGKISLVRALTKLLAMSQ